MTFGAKKTSDPKPVASKPASTSYSNPFAKSKLSSGPSFGSKASPKNPPLKTKPEKKISSEDDYDNDDFDPPSKTNIIKSGESMSEHISEDLIEEYDDGGFF